MKTRDLVLVGLFAAMTAVGAFLNIPTPTVPFSLQFFFCAYAGVFLGAKKAFISQLLYICIGLAGIPVFTKGGGLGYVFQPTFGFIIGFAACAFIIGLITEQLHQPGAIKIFLSVLAGLSSIYLIGLPYFYFMFNYTMGAEKAISFETAVAWAFTPFILFDLLKALIIGLTSVKIVTILRKQGFVS